MNLHMSTVYRIKRTFAIVSFAKVLSINHLYSIVKVNSGRSNAKAEVTLANPYAEVTLANFTSLAYFML